MPTFAKFRIFPDVLIEKLQYFHDGSHTQMPTIIPFSYFVYVSNQLEIHLYR